MQKDELLFVAILSWLLMLTFAFNYIEADAEVRHYDNYYKQATDECKQEYVDYNLSIYGSRR